MKIIIRKKYLGSLSSLLVLTFLQPTANADSQVSTRNTSTYFQSSITEDEKQRGFKNTPLPATKLSLISSNYTQHSVYKSGISQAFSDYHKALDDLEERYQDKIDKVLDQYEENIRLARIDFTAPEEQAKQAKQSAAKLLATLKKQHQANQTALKQQYHIS